MDESWVEFPLAILICIITINIEIEIEIERDVKGVINLRDHIILSSGAPSFFE